MSKRPSSPREKLLGIREKSFRWRITRIRTTPAVEVGTVEARDAESAIKEAIKYYGITDPEHQARLAARRIG
jgi:hypothetical protein